MSGSLGSLGLGNAPQVTDLGSAHLSWLVAYLRFAGVFCRCTATDSCSWHRFDPRADMLFVPSQDASLTFDVMEAKLP